MWRVLALCLLVLTFGGCAAKNNLEAAPERYSDLHFDNKDPIRLAVQNVNVRSEFTPSFTRPNVEHQLPISIEKTAKTWANERLTAADAASGRTAEFIIKDASVTEKEVKAEQLFQKDRLQYHAVLSVTLQVVDKGASAQTSVNAYRDLTMPIDTSIEDKEMRWNEMVINLFKSFDKAMEDNVYKSLNMYIKDNNQIVSY